MLVVHDTKQLDWLEKIEVAHRYVKYINRAFLRGVIDNYGKGSTHPTSIIFVSSDMFRYVHIKILLDPTNRHNTYMHELNVTESC